MKHGQEFRKIPSIDRLLLAAETATPGRYPHELLVEALRQAVEEIRQAVRAGAGEKIEEAAILSAAEKILKKTEQSRLRRVINATGVVLHTNLGRAPLGQRAIAAVNNVMGGYSTLEYSLETGERGTRYAHVEERICRMTGAEAAIVVNNNAAAVLLTLSALAKDREVLVSRGELVEIGGSFRVPDVMRQSGAALVEVGATNKTHLYDYERAITVNTAAILKVHTSNYRIIGFTSQPETPELANLARDNGLALLEDLGSGTLLPVTAGGYSEPTVRERLEAGVDLVTFSGDKLLGAGQAGIIAGKRQYVELLKKHPLLRAVRIDKLSLAALEGTLLEYLTGDASENLPVLAMLQAEPAALRKKAEQLATELQKCLSAAWRVSVEEMDSQTGGGAFPAVALPGFGVALTCTDLKTDAMEKYLRCRDVPIIARVQSERLLFDVRCLNETDTVDIIDACGAMDADR
ncbi:MAG TPA: L-seryl-tRNA(Sec) selenium transferase [Patescibacteria group bacterium]|nr:L-seryl-tRNA(Sec) selenium transferase [Patescibacteria group bacterium]